jgi:Putative metal-binding motif
VLAALLVPVSSATAGRLIETGEVPDVSCVTDSALGGCHFLRVALDYVRSGAPDPSKPILLFDEPPDNMLHAIQAAYGGSPPFSIDEHEPRSIDFNTFTITPSQFSAIVVASDYTCGNFASPFVACGDLNAPPAQCPVVVVPPDQSCITPDSNALVEPAGHNAINNFYNLGGGILIGSGGDNGDGHADDLYYDFVNAPRGLPFNGDPSTLTPLGRRLGFTSGDIGHSDCPQEDDGAVTDFQALTCPFNAFFPLPAGSSLKVAETDNAGDPVTLFQDTDPPHTTITSAPPMMVVTRGPAAATFRFTASENLVTFECRLDSGAFSACSSPVTYTGLGQGMHVFSVRAIDAAGNVEAAPPAASWLIAFDRDGDGYTLFSNPPDCNDNNPHIYPGAPEKRGGHVDSDCDGVIDPFLVMHPRVTFAGNAGKKSTRFTKFVVAPLPAHAKVQISCSGRRHCPFGRATARVKRGSRQVSFLGALKGRHLPVGLVVVVRATNAQTIGSYESLQIRSNTTPREAFRCMNPGSLRPRSSCPRYSG